jgi:hypothetical protein
MNKHTPGPWTVRGDYFDIGTDAAAVATAHGPTRAIQDANAKLIVAAPDMAEALRNFIGFAEYHEMEKKNPRLQLQLLEMRRALAKAGL